MSHCAPESCLLMAKKCLFLLTDVWLFSSVSCDVGVITSVFTPVIFFFLNICCFCFQSKCSICSNYIPPRISEVVISSAVYEGCHWPNPHGRACPVRRPCDGLALAVATRLGVKLGTVVEMRVRSNALVCFDDGGDWSSQQTGRSSSGGRMNESIAAVDAEIWPEYIQLKRFCTGWSFVSTRPKILLKTWLSRANQWQQWVPSLSQIDINVQL